MSIETTTDEDSVYGERIARIEATLPHLATKTDLARVCWRTMRDMKEAQAGAIGKRKHNYGISTAVRLARIEAELPHLATKCELMSIDGGSKALQTDEFINDKLSLDAERSQGERLAAIEWTIPNLVTKAELERARGYRRAMRVFPWRRLSGDNPGQDVLFSTQDYLLMLLAPCLTVLVMYLLLFPLMVKLLS